MDLPFYPYKDDILKAIHEYQVLVVVGDTGSGKTTQLPKYLLESTQLNIAVTQPRRIACISAANRVSQEIGSLVGQEVGYSIRFEQRISPKTRLTFMTDGTLLNRGFDDFDVVVIDEAHERSLETDVLFGLLKRTLRTRDIKVIIMSATLDTDRFSDFFDSCPVFSVPGRVYEVDILWQKSMDLKVLKSTYVQRSIDTALYIHKTEDQGDILVFLTGQSEIEKTIRELRDADTDIHYKDLTNGVKGMVVYPIYSSLESLEQRAIFEPAPKTIRKIIVATNIAQTSITVPGIKYVVDCGFVKQKQYDSKTGMNALLVVPISQAAATQRAGRAGRTENGKVYRLYCKSAFEEMSETTIPEIQRSSLSSTVLYLLKVGITDVLNFDFVDMPEPDAIVDAIKQLFLLSAVDEHGHLTHIGKVMADLKISPFLARALLSAAEDFNCSEEVLTIVSILSAEDFLMSPRSEKKQELAEKARLCYLDSTGDHLTYLNMYMAWEAEGYSKDFCVDHFFHYRALISAKNIREQLKNTMERHKLPLVSCLKKKKHHKVPSSARIPILCSLGAGLYLNTAKKHSNRPYFFPYVSSVNDTETSHMLALYISPQSNLCKIDPEKLDWVFYNDIQYVNRAQMRVVSRIEFGMIEVLFGRLALMDVRKLCKLESHTPHELPYGTSEQPESIPVTEFEMTHEVILPTEHKEISTDGTVVSKSQTEAIQSSEVERKRSEARERYLQRKKQKQT